MMLASERAHVDASSDDDESSRASHTAAPTHRRRRSRSVRDEERRADQPLPPLSSSSSSRRLARRSESLSGAVADPDRPPRRQRRQRRKDPSGRSGQGKASRRSASVASTYAPAAPSSSSSARRRQQQQQQQQQQHNPTGGSASDAGEEETGEELLAQIRRARTIDLSDANAELIIHAIESRVNDESCTALLAALRTLQESPVFSSVAPMSSAPPSVTSTEQTAYGASGLFALLVSSSLAPRPQHDVASLQSLLESVTKLLASRNLQYDTWQRGLLLFAAHLLFWIYAYVRRSLLLELHGLRTHIAYWRDVSSSSGMLRYMQQGPRYWVRQRPQWRQGLGTWMRDIQYQQRKEAQRTLHELSLLEENLLEQIGLMHANTKQVSFLLSELLHRTSSTMSAAEEAEAAGMASFSRPGTTGSPSPEVDSSAASFSTPVAPRSSNAPTASSRSAPPTNVRLAPSDSAPAPPTHSALVFKGVDQLTRRLYKFLSGRDIRPSGDCGELLALQGSLLSTVPEFEHRLSRFLQRLQKPSHARRHWINYSASAVLAAGSAYYLYSNWTDVRAWASDSVRSLHGFAVAHIWEPTKAIYRHVFEAFRDGRGRATKTSLEEQRDSLRRMLLSYGKANASASASARSQDKDAFLAELPERANNEDMTIVMEQYERDIEHPIISAANGQLIHGMTVQGQKAKVDGENVLLALDQILMANEINFQMLSIIPAAAVLGALAWASKAAWRWITNRSGKTKSGRSAHRVMRKQLRLIETMLLFRLGHRFDDIHWGTLIYRVFCVRRAAVEGDLPEHEVHLLDQDLQLLIEPDLSIRQRLQVVHRISRTHRWATV